MKKFLFLTIFLFASIVLSIFSYKKYQKHFATQISYKFPFPPMEDIREDYIRLLTLKEKSFEEVYQLATYEVQVAEKNKDFSLLRQAEERITLVKNWQYHKDALLLLGEIYKLQHNFKALKPITSILMNWPEADLDIYNFLIGLKLQMQPDQIVQEEILDLIQRSKTAKNYYLLAQFYEQIGNYYQAEQAILRSLELEVMGDNFFSLKLRKNLAQILLSNKSYRKFLQVINTLRNMDPDDKDISLLMGDFYFQQEKFFRAQLQYQKALQTNFQSDLIIKKNLSLIGQRKSLNLEELQLAENILRQEIQKGNRRHLADLSRILLLKNTPESIAETKSLIDQLPMKTLAKNIQNYLQKIQTKNLNQKNRQPILLNSANLFFN